MRDDTPFYVLICRDEGGEFRPPRTWETDADARRVAVAFARAGYEVTILRCSVVGRYAIGGERER